MGRKRSIDQDQILDAAERVVARNGAADLTVERVAQEAGVSKASVLYDFKTKQAVLEAVVQRAFLRDNAHHAAVEAEIANGPDVAIRTRIRAAVDPPPDDYRNAALNLSAALVLNEGLRRKMQDNQKEVLGRIAASSASPRGAQLAYLALEGLKLLEHFDFFHFSLEERGRVLREIEWLAGTRPVAESAETAD